MAGDSQETPPVCRPVWLHPYASFIILQCDGPSWADAFARLAEFMKKYKSSNANTTYRMIASGLGEISDVIRSNTGSEFDELDGFITERISAPSWASQDSPYRDISHSLAVALRRDRLIAVHCDPTLRTAIQKWLDRTPKPPVKRIDSSVLQSAFLRGEAKGLWLRGTHVRRTTKADSKTLSGRKLQDALSPFEDSSFAMSTARAALDDSPSRKALTGTVGTTPRRALIWNKATSDFRMFVEAVDEALNMVAETIDSQSAMLNPYPILATESHDLTKVFGAYDITSLSSDDLPAMDVHDDLFTAADILQHAILQVRAVPDSPNFILDVGTNGAIGGSLRVMVNPSGDGVKFVVGFDAESEPTNLPSVREVKNALEFSEELLTVYYDSGHMVDGRSIWVRNVRPMKFPRWKFADFSGFDITQEKPFGSLSSIDIHDKICSAGDTSIFNWVVENYRDGWLTCDDGPGEVADFIHIANDGMLSLIHVKAAGSRAPNRRIAVGSYEVVASQAAKNFVNLEPAALRDRLTAPIAATRATWTQGLRMPDRVDFIEALDCRDSSNEYRVVIVQPNVNEKMYDRLHKAENSSVKSEDIYRLNLLETLLNTIRGTVTSLGADMEVIASKI